MNEVNKIDFLEQPKSKKHVDIQKAIFRKVRKFWKNYQENHRDLVQFRERFRAFCMNMDNEKRKKLYSCINSFTDCRARLKNIDDPQMELIWASCYSYNNKVAR